MRKAPTYTAREIHDMVGKMDADSCKILIGVINEELDLYDEPEVQLLAQASIKIFIQAALLGALKHL